MELSETKTDQAEIDQLVLTKEKLNQIRAWIDKVQGNTLDAEGALGYLEMEYPQLSAVSAIKKMRMQAREWKFLEKRICEVCNGFSVYGQETKKTAGEILDRISNMPVFQRIGAVIESEESEEIKRLLTGIARDGDICQRKTAWIQKDIEVYRTKLETEIMPDVRAVCETIKKIPPLDITVTRDEKEYHVFIEKGGFMKKSPAVKSFTSNFGSANSEKEALESIHRLEKWEQPLIEEMLQSFTKIEKVRAGIEDILDKVKKMEIAWNVVISHTQEVIRDWEAVDERESLLKIQTEIHMFMNHCRQAQQYVDAFSQLFHEQRESRK